MSVSDPARRLVAVSFAVFIALGLSAGVTGVAWPSMSDAFARPLADLGVLLVVGTAGYFVAGLLSGRLSARLGLGDLLTLTLIIGTASLVGYALVDSWPLLLACAVGTGLAGGMIDSALNSYVALNHDTRTMNLLHAFFGIGAMIGPIMVGSLLARGTSWRTAYVILAVVELLLVVAVFAVRRGWPLMANVAEGQRSHGRLETSVVGLLLLFVLYVGIEVAAGQWAFSLLTESRGMAELAAAIWVAVYWGGLTGGRLALGFIGDRVAPRTILHLSMAGSVIGSVVFWLDLMGLGVIGLTLLGVSLAGVFPVLVSLTPSWVGEERASVVIGYQISAAAAGSALIPWLAGVLVNAVGLESIGPFLCVIALAMAMVHWLVDRAVN